MNCNGAADGPDSVRETVRALLARDDTAWYAYRMRADIQGRTLSARESGEVIRRSVETAEEIASRFRGPGQDTCPASIAQRLGVRIRQTADEGIGGYMYMGLSDPAAHTILLNSATLGKVTDFLTEHALTDWIAPPTVRTVALYHELFHAIEDRTPGIYTRSRMLQRRILGLFPYRKGLELAGEIGAIHFSKCMSGIPYSPCLYEQILLWASGQPVGPVPFPDS